MSVSHLSRRKNNRILIANCCCLLIYGRGQCCRRRFCYCSAMWCARLGANAVLEFALATMAAVCSFWGLWNTQSTKPNIHCHCCPRPHGYIEASRHVWLCEEIWWTRTHTFAAQMKLLKLMGFETPASAYVTTPVTPATLNARFY